MNLKALYILNYELFHFNCTMNKNHDLPKIVIISKIIHVKTSSAATKTRATTTAEKHPKNIIRVSTAETTMSTTTLETLFAKSRNVNFSNVKSEFFGKSGKDPGSFQGSKMNFPNFIFPACKMSIFKWENFKFKFS